MFKRINSQGVLKARNRINSHGAVRGEFVSDAPAECGIQPTLAY
jgi:hypothetical protein